MVMNMVRVRVRGLGKIWVGASWVRCSFGISVAVTLRHGAIFEVGG